MQNSVIPYADLAVITTVFDVGAVKLRVITLIRGTLINLLVRDGIEFLGEM